LFNMSGISQIKSIYKHQFSKVKIFIDFVREQDICDKEIKNKKELCYNASDQTNKITGDPSYETYYNRRTETS